VRDHLPECFGTAGLLARVPQPCICDRLRACEQRIRADERERIAAMLDTYSGEATEKATSDCWKSPVFTLKFAAHEVRFAPRGGA